MIQTQDLKSNKNRSARLVPHQVSQGYDLEWYADADVSPHQYLGNISAATI